MLNFGKPIKHRIVYENSKGERCTSFMNCINENDAEKILASIEQVDFKRIVSCEVHDGCNDCKF